MDNLDVYSIHLIRDPRGIAYSRKKKMLQPDKEKTIYIERFNSFDSFLKWNIRNLLAEYLWKQNKDIFESMGRKEAVDQIFDFMIEELMDKIEDWKGL